MKVVLLPSAVGGDAQNQYLTSYVINDRLAVDAGSLGFHRTPEEQARVRDVLVSHTHIDHLASLPPFVENVYRVHPEVVTIYGNEAVLDCLRRDVFNNRLWPDMINLAPGGKPFIRLELLESGREVQMEGLTVTPVAVDHTVPTLGFIIEDANAAIVIASDTGPTDAIWEQANHTSKLKAVFLEAAFPNAMTELAGVSKHHTPASFVGDVRKLAGRPRILAVHLKARFWPQIEHELKQLGLSNLEVARPGQTYYF